MVMMEMDTHYWKYSRNYHSLDDKDGVPEKKWWETRTGWAMKWAHLREFNRTYNYRTSGMWRSDFDDWYSRDCEGDPPPTTTFLDVHRENLRRMRMANG